MDGRGGKVRKCAWEEGMLMKEVGVEKNRRIKGERGKKGRKGNEKGEKEVRKG